MRHRNFREGAYEVNAINVRLGVFLACIASACARLPAQPPTDNAAAAEPALGRQRGVVEAPVVNEASGMVASRNNAGVLWVHNDSGDAARVYALDTRGRYLGAFRLEGIQAIDCEDLAMGPGPLPGVDYLYLGDIGDNEAQRDTIRLYRFPEPVVASSGGDQSMSLGRPDVITLSYPDGPRDAETLLCDPRSGELVIVSKGDAGNRVYRCPALPAGSHTRRLEYVGGMSWPVFPSSLLGAVAGDVSPEGHEILIKNYAGAFLYQRPAQKSIGEAIIGDAIGTSVPCRKERMGESIAFDPTGTGYYTLSEGRRQPLYYYARAGNNGTPPLERLVSAGADWNRIVPKADANVSESPPVRFEHSFPYHNSAPLARLCLKITGNESVAVSLNGKPIARIGRAAGPDTDDSTAPRSTAQWPKIDHATWMTIDVPPRLLPGLLRSGANTLTVETKHRAQPEGKPPFDLQLLAAHGDTVPEPSAFWMLGPAGAVLVLAYFWRRHCCLRHRGAQA